MAAGPDDHELVAAAQEAMISIVRWLHRFDLRAQLSTWV